MKPRFGLICSILRNIFLTTRLLWDFYSIQCHQTKPLTIDRKLKIQRCRHRDTSRLTHYLGPHLYNPSTAFLLKSDLVGLWINSLTGWLERCRWQMQAGDNIKLLHTKHLFFIITVIYFPSFFFFLRWKNSFNEKTNVSAKVKESHVLMLFFKKVTIELVHALHLPPYFAD